VVASRGGLGGYGGGLEVKRWLLQHEASRQPLLLRPT
jgi:methylated-DNA-[protein]-cysteine S-methyltransferase